MGREIKLKAWDLKRKKMGWVESLFCDYKNDTEKDDWICYTTDEMKIEERPCGDYREKQNVILMQYTGLKDKNGKEIYEGDIIKFADSLHGYISFKEGKFIIVYIEKNLPKKEQDCGTYLNCYEVTSNIYETPELLE